MLPAPPALKTNEGERGKLVVHSPGISSSYLLEQPTRQKRARARMGVRMGVLYGLTADRVHRPEGLDKPRGVDLVAFPFTLDVGQHLGRNLLIRNATAQQ